MDYDAIRRGICRPPKKAGPKATASSTPPPPPPPKPANPTPAAPPPGPPDGPGFPLHKGHCMGEKPHTGHCMGEKPHTGHCMGEKPHMRHYMGEFENVGDQRFGYMEHSRTWRLGFNPNYIDNYSHQGYQGQIPVPQEYYEGCYGDPRMNSRENFRQIGYYPDHSSTFDHHHDSHYNSQSHPGYITPSRGPMGISGPPPRLALPPPVRYMDDHQDHDHHHGYGQLSQGRSYGCNHLAPRVREFGPRASGPPQLLGPPPYDPYYISGGPSRAQYNLPYQSSFSDENPNACSVM